MRKLLIAALLMAGCFLPVSAQDAPVDPYAQGTKYFQSKQYASAAKCFEKAINENPRNHVAYYYRALALHYSKDIAGAKAEYARTIKFFPMSDAAGYSRRALAILDPALLRSISPDYQVPSGTRYASNARPSGTSRSASSSSTSASHASNSGGYSSPHDRFPDEARVAFTREAGCMFVEGQFNNRPSKIMFDTASEGTIFGKNHLQAMGIPAPSGEPTGTSTSGGSVQKTWDMRMDIKIGSIERGNFPVVIKESMLDSPSLGQSFFKDFAYSVDNNARTINFVKKGSRSAAGMGSASSSQASRSSDPNNVPFTKDDNDQIVVTVMIEGKQAQMYFDTGASGVMMSRDQARKFGITVPEDAQDTVANGTSAQLRGKKFPIRSLRMGPIDKRNFDISVIDNFNFGLPLLGQSFFGDSNYTIDNDAKLIRFSRH